SRWKYRFSVELVAKVAPPFNTTAGVPVKAALAKQFWNCPPVITHSPTVTAKVPVPDAVYRPVAALKVPAARVAGANCGPPGAATPAIYAYPPGCRTTKVFKLLLYWLRDCGLTGKIPAMVNVSPTLQAAELLVSPERFKTPDWAHPEVRIAEPPAADVMPARTGLPSSEPV